MFNSSVCRPRSRVTGEQRTCVGQWGSGLKGWDFGKATWRSAFDGDVVYNFEAQEAMLDQVFDRLSLTGKTTLCMCM